MVARKDRIDGLSEPTGLYSLASLVSPGKGLAWISGQTGRGPDHSMPEAVYLQTMGALEAILKIVSDMDALPTDIVHLRTFLTDRSDIADFDRGREESLSALFRDSAPPTSTLVIVSGLVDPRARVEIEAVLAVPTETST